MPTLQLLHEQDFGGKPLLNLKVYHDPFGEHEMCVELTFSDGSVACLAIASGRPRVVSSRLCYEIPKGRERVAQTDDRSLHVGAA
jgi:hypothetical protein